MRREYQKPYLVLESFQLNAAIAASCSSQDKIAINFYRNGCQLGDDPGEDTFHLIGAACPIDALNVEGGDGNDTFCYHGPQYDNLFFNS